MANDDCEVVIIGAGPYGLSIATHLKAAKIATRIFGDTMGFWRRNMPNGMKLRSPWRASHLDDPNKEHSLDNFAREHEIAKVENLPLADFVRYGEWFQRRSVPDVDTRMVRRVGFGPSGFRTQLADGDSIDSKCVVVAMGLTNQAYKPAEFDGLPSSLVSHSGDVVNPADFRGRRVAVIGRGQSACESAVLLHEAGAEVEQIARGDVRWIGAEAGQVQHRDWLFRVREALQAPSAIGPFPYNWLVDLPMLLHHLPPELRERIALLNLRPAASAWLKARAVGMRINPGRTIVAAKAKGDNHIDLQLDTGTTTYDHVVLATGYRTNVGKLGILADEVLAQVAHRGNYPVLSAGFESSVAGLHFVGSPAVGSFGALPRFVAGAGFAARRVTQAARAGASRPSTRMVARPLMQQR